jgi:putative transposase
LYAGAACHQGAAISGTAIDLLVAEHTMCRSLRNAPPEVVQHCVNRGNRKATIFHEAGDYQAFMTVLREAGARFPMRLLGFCAMPNHWHLVLWPPEGVSVSSYMQWVTTTHVRRYHLGYGLVGTGHLYQDRFRNGGIRDDRTLLSVLRYVEANPVHAGLVERAELWPWSSLRLRAEGDPDGLLFPLPMLPTNWLEIVNECPRADKRSERRRRAASVA